VLKFFLFFCNAHLRFSIIRSIFFLYKIQINVAKHISYARSEYIILRAECSVYNNIVVLSRTSILRYRITSAFVVVAGKRLQQVELRTSARVCINIMSILSLCNSETRVSGLGYTR